MLNKDQISLIDPDNEQKENYYKCVLLVVVLFLRQKFKKLKNEAVAEEIV